MAGLDLAKVVSEKQPYEWTETEWTLGSGYGGNRRRASTSSPTTTASSTTSCACWRARLPVTVVPAQTPAAEVLKHQPDGVFLSNGPGDPEPCDYAIAPPAS